VFLGDLVENIKPGSGDDQEIEGIFRCFFYSWDFLSLDQVVKELLMDRSRLRVCKVHKIDAIDSLGFWTSQFLRGDRYVNFLWGEITEGCPDCGLKR
jgi:hypothetical protein